MADEPIVTPETTASAPSETTPVQTPAPSPVDSTPSVPSTSTPFSARDYLKSQNLNVDGFQDDKALVDTLLNIYREHEQGKQYIPYGQEYAKNKDQFEAWRKVQAEQLAAQQKPAPKEPWWKKPDFDPNWENQVILDAQGNYVPKQGYSPEIAAKMNAFVAHQRKVFRDFSTDPMSVIRPGIEEVAREIAQKMVDEKLAGLQTQQFIQTFEEKNAQWLFQQSPNGIAYDPTGNPIVSKLGGEFYQITKGLRDGGMTDPRLQEHWARQVLGTRIAQATQPAPTPEQQNAALKNSFLKPHSGTLAPAANTVLGAPVQNPNLTFEQMLRQSFKEAGITDEAIQGENIVA